MTQIIQTPEQQFYLTKLLGYSYTIVYKPGNQNKVADALSRAPDPGPTLLAITVPQLDFLDKLKEELQADSSFQELLQKVLQEPSTYEHFQVIENLLFFKGKLYLPSHSPFKKLLLEEFHSSTLGGHNGNHKTLGRLHDSVYWDGMLKDVT
jgi:hypothetical protein